MNRTSIIKSIIFAAVALAAGGTWADTEKVGDYTWTYRIIGDTAEIYNSSWSAAISPTPTGAVTIPATLGGYPVTSIGNWAFYNCSGLTSVTIPDSVTSIGTDAFYYCSGLTSVTIPDSVTSIGQYAFYNCSGLTSVTIPQYVLGRQIRNVFPSAYSSLTNVSYSSTITKIGASAFRECSKLTSVTIPNNVTSIGQYAFYNCSGLTSVTIPDGVTNIGYEAFRNCSGLTSVTIPDSVTSIGNDAFSWCSGLEEITLPFVGARRGNTGSYYSVFGYIFGTSSYTGGTGTRQYYSDSLSYYAVYYIPSKLKKVVITDETVLGYGAFYNCSGLTSVTIPGSVTNIGSSAFSSCSGLRSVTIPGSVTNIGSYAFSSCSGLRDVMMEDGVTNIGERAFYNCRDLTSVTIPSSVTSLGGCVFYNCSRLATVYYLGDAPVADSHLYGYDGSGSLTSYVLKGTRGWDGIENSRALPEKWPAGDYGCPITYWEANTFDLVFDGNGGTPATTVIAQTTDATYSLPATDPEREGWAFDGWWTERAAGARVTASVPVKAVDTHTLYAHWTLLGIPAKVRFFTDGVESEQDFTVGIAYGSLPAPKKKGYVFAGWKTADGDTVTEASVVRLAGAQLYAQWEAGYVVEFNANGGVCDVARSIVSNGAAIGELPTATRDDYVFLGWFTAAEGGEPVTAETVVTDDVTYWAHWRSLFSEQMSAALGVEGVEFAAGGSGRWFSQSAVTHDGESAAQSGRIGNSQSTWMEITVEGPVRVSFWWRVSSELGYDYLRWYVDGMQKSSISGSQGWSQQSADVGAGTHTIKWQYSKNGSGTSGSDCGWVDDLTIKPFFIVAFDANGGTGTMASASMVKSESVTLPPCAFIRAGHRFAGWSRTASGTVDLADGAEVSDLAGELNGVVTLYAVWREQAWTTEDYLNVAMKGVSFGTGDGDADWLPDTATSHDGIGAMRSGAIGAAEEGGRTRSTMTATVLGEGSGSFWWKVNCEAQYNDEWYDYVVFAVDGVEQTKIAGDMDWRKVSFTVSGAGEHLLSWTFTRDDWDEPEDVWENSAWVDELAWSPKAVTVSFGAAGATEGTAPGPIVSYAGAEIVLPDAGTLAKPPYSFGGWSDGSATYAAGDVFTVGTKNGTLTAVWTLDWTLEDAAGAAGLAFRTGGDAGWFASVPGRTDTVLIRSGQIGHSQESWIETTVNGPGTMTFWWKVAGEVNRSRLYDYAKVSLDGEIVHKAGRADWTNLMVRVTSEGEHTIRWSYLKNDSVSVADDCAWLDDVKWTSGGSGDVVVDVGGGKTVTVPRVWLAENTTRTATNVAANGRKVWECYVLGIDPESTTNDFKITSFPMKADGTPDLANIVFEPPQTKWNVPAAYKVKGASTLEGPWGEVSAGGNPSYRFFKVEVVLP